MEFIGIDVHKNKSQIYGLSGETGEVWEKRINTTAKRFAAVLSEREPAKILIEASTESEWVAQCLEGMGHEVIVADPNFSPMYGWRTRGVKTDRTDAQSLAEACRTGTYRKAHRVSKEQGELRTQLAVREIMVRQRTKIISLVRATIRRQGLRVPTGASHTFGKRVEEMELPEETRELLAPLMRVMETLNEQIKDTHAKLEDQARNDTQLYKLQSVPAIGPLTAAAFAARIDVPERFRSARQVGCYLGLVPREHSSGGTQRRGHITKAGDTRVRYLLMQAAVNIMRVRAARAKPLYEWADRIALRRGKRVALIALARKLSSILFAMMKHDAIYDPQKVGQSKKDAA